MAQHEAVEISQQGQVLRVEFGAGLQKTDLKQIQQYLAERWHLHLEYQKLDYDKDGYLRAIDFHISTEDDYSGSASALLQSPYRVAYFQRDWRPGAATPFGTGTKLVMGP